jgi:hypothetical protein
LVLSKNSILTGLQLHGGVANQVPATVVGVVVNLVLNAQLLLVVVNLAARRACNLHWLPEGFRNQGEAVTRFLLVLIT